MTIAEFKRQIAEKGFYLQRQAKGSHEIWSNGIIKVVIANHRGNIPNGTLEKMLKKVGLK